MSDKIREAFEAWAASGAMSIATLDRFAQYPKGTYEDSRTHASWLGWQASRLAALEEAAQVCDSLGPQMEDDECARWPFTSCAGAIRSLADNPPAAAKEE